MLLQITVYQLFIIHVFYVTGKTTEASKACPVIIITIIISSSSST